MGLFTLNKFGVPIFSDGNPAGTAGKIGMLQPKPQYRYKVRVRSFGAAADKVEDLTRQVANVTRPTLNYTPVTVDSYNSRAYYAGKHEWQEITLAIRDDITNTATKLVGRQVQKQLNHHQQTGYPAASNYKFEMYIEMLDGGNVNVLEEWFLEGCFLSSINWGNLAYDSSEPTMIEMNIRYDNAQYAGENGTETSLFPVVGPPATASGEFGVGVGNL